MYDDYGAVNAVCVHVPVPVPANDAAEAVANVQLFKRVKLLAAKACIVGNSYDEATSTLDIYVDDGSVGAIILTTETKNVCIDATLTETVVSATSSITLVQSHATATGACDVYLKYEELFD